ncbi:HGGxSTG domain-containing protein [Bacillota bacterium LX-D]|nr:HGGxSTG domain-containing protein [Bacillota bacterium LX-D]
MDKKQCGAKTRSGEPCKKAALANGRCRLHGGKSTGPKDKKKHSERLTGNKNALKHGLYETIWLDTLTDEERELFAQVATDPTAQVENEFRLCDIRIRRMMQRIRKEEQKDKPDMRRINAIEEAITKVQLNKANLIRENSRLLELNETESDGALDKLAEIIRQARQKHGN